MANIFIVDDSPTEVHVLKAMLEKNGHTVDSADNAESGIKKITAKKQYRIVLKWI